MDGRAVRLTSPTDAQRLGIATVYQDLALAPELAASENLYLGRELLKAGIAGRLGVLDRKSMRRESASQFAKLGIHLRSPAVSVASLSGGQRQSIAIARAAMWADKVIFMDEPTAALGVVQTARVLDLIRSVRDSGIAVAPMSPDRTSYRKKIWTTKTSRMPCSRLSRTVCVVSATRSLRS